MLLTPNEVDSQGDVFTFDDIQRYKTSEALMSKTNLNHEKKKSHNQDLNGVYVLENYITRTPEQIKDKNVPVGSWRRDYLIQNPELIQKIQEGKINGVSVEASLRTCPACSSNKDMNNDDVLLNKRLSSTECLKPTYVSFVRKPANGYKMNMHDYESYKLKKSMKYGVNDYMTKSEINNEKIDTTKTNETSLDDNVLDRLAKRLNNLINNNEEAKIAKQKEAQEAIEAVFPRETLEDIQKGMKILTDDYNERKKEKMKTQKEKEEPKEAESEPVQLKNTSNGSQNKRISQDPKDLVEKPKQKINHLGIPIVSKVNKTNHNSKYDYGDLGLNEPINVNMYNK